MLSNLLEKVKPPPPTLDHQRLNLLKPEDFQLGEASQPEMMFSNLAEVRQIPTQQEIYHRQVHLFVGSSMDVSIDGRRTLFRFFYI